MAVGAEEMHDASLEPILEGALLAPIARLGDALGGNLHETPHPDQILDGAVAVEQFRASLGMGQNRTHACPAQALHGVAQVYKKSVRHLDEEILASVRHTQKLILSPGRLDLRVNHDLGTGKSRKGNAMCSQLLREPLPCEPNAIGSIFWIMFALMRSRSNDARALGVGDPAHFKCFFVRSRAVIEPGEKMTVNVNQGN